MISSNAGKKSLELLFQEINISIELKKNIQQIYNQIIGIYEKLYKNYSIENIQKEIRDFIIPKKRSIIYTIASMIRVIELEFHFILREIQIISLIICILNNHNNGLIEEIKTGEGKSLIIALLAIIHCLDGKKVDILTSSSVLAERDSLDLKKIYSYYHLSTDYCKINNKIDENNDKYDNYNADICYGDSLSLEGDILRSEFLGEIGRGNRPFDCIIVDEIDNLCIDNIKNQTELIDNFPGFKFLEYFYLYIYNALQKIISNKEIDKKDQLVRMNIINKLVEISKKFLVNNKIKPENEKIYYPEYLDEFIENRLKDWCNAAFSAIFDYEINKNYIINKDKNNNDVIQPIDFSNTGIIRQNSVWNGLHQFLQIKHGLRLTEENLSSCFISNLIFFKLYKNLYGFTGTLGSLKTQEAIKEIYNIELV